MKKTISILCAAVLLVSTLILTACNIPFQKPEEDAKAVSYVSVDINPEVELTLNSEEKVISVCAANEDAQVLLYGEVDLTGMDVEAAIDTLVDLAVEQGYLTEDNKVVDTTVVGDETTVESILQKIEEKIHAAGEKHGFGIKCSHEGVFSIQRRLEEFQAAHPEDEQIANLTLGEFKLAWSAASTGEVTLEVAVTMEREELLALLKTAHEDMKHHVTEEYKKKTEEAEKKYHEALEEAKDDLYTQYFFSHPMKYHGKLHYGAVYQMYRYAARALYGMADLMDTANEVYTQELAEEQIEAVVAALGLAEDELDLIRDDEGNITIESIESYADVLFKNAEEGEDYREVKHALAEALRSCESHIHNMLKRGHFPKVELTLEGVETYINVINTQLALIPGAQEAMAEFITDVNAIVEELKALAESEELTSDDLRAAADKLDAKAKEMHDKIVALLTEEEKAEIEDQHNHKKQELDDYRQEMEDKFAEAKQQAEEYLSQKKQDREHHYGGHGHGGKH